VDLGRETLANSRKNLRFSVDHLEIGIASCEFRLKPARDSDAKPATIPG
jgi:hypothetical protein